MPQFLLVYMVEQQDLNTSFSKWPLHMTVMPWFEAQDSESVAIAISPIIKECQPFHISIASRDYFGTNRSLPVMRVAADDSLMFLHKNVLSILERNGWNVGGRYTGDHYTPHVTQQAGRDASGKYLVDKIHIAEALSQGYRRLVAEIGLGS